MLDANILPEDLLQRARSGDEGARGRLLDLYRNYLRLLARMQMGAGLRARLDPSDVVQDALLEAHRDFTGFVGQSEQELLAWLRQVLVRGLLDQAKRHSARKRDGRRQQSLEALLAASSGALGDAFTASGPTPSGHAARREQVVLLADALERLPPDYREVILLRNMQRLPFEEVAQRMGRKAGAVRMLWARAIEKLGQEMGETP
jgi:RNA polymerase sigma-70 factor (ECF subfamily)